MRESIRIDSTLGVFIDSVAGTFGSRPAVIARDRSYPEPRTIRRTYAELASDVIALQAGLTKLGVRPKDRVAVLLSSFYEWLLYLFALTRMGAVLVPLNPRYGASEVTHILTHAKCSALVAFGSYHKRDYAALLRDVVGRATPGGYSAMPWLALIVGVRTSPHEDAVAHEEVMALGRESLASGRRVEPATDPDADAILFYTSGTTAFPKGVLLSHRNVLPHSVLCGSVLDTTELDRALTLYPFFGIVGGANKTLSTIGYGACLVFPDAFHVEDAFELLHDEDCRIIHALDIHVRELMAVARRRGCQAPERRGTIAFMSGVDEAIAREMAGVLGIRRFVHGYGTTETNPLVLRNELDDPFDVQLRPGGWPAPGVEVRVVDSDSGVRCPADMPGEIEVRGPNVTRGYLDDAAATASAFRDGWFRTRDKGVMTTEGTIFFLSRARDMLKVGGYNVAPQEVEQFVRSHPAVEDVGVAGAPDERLGEVVIAFVKLRPDEALSLEELREYCNGRIANFKMPAHLRIVDDLPYLPAANGRKLRRDALRDWVAEEFQVSEAKA